MDKDRIKGSAQQAKGNVKEVAGKATGDKKLEGEGKADKVSGKIRNAVGGMKDALREVRRRRSPRVRRRWRPLGTVLVPDARGERAVSARAGAGERRSNTRFVPRQLSRSDCHAKSSKAAHLGRA